MKRTPVYLFAHGDTNFSCLIAFLGFLGPQPIYKTCSVENQDFVSQWSVFRMLDQLRPTSTGLDCLPAWFLKLVAPIFCKHIAYPFNLSITERFDPQQ